MAVDPAGAALAQMLEEDPGGPVVMLNLLRFAPGGRTSYEEYSRKAAGFLRKYGAEDGQDWDAVLMVRYPDRKTFSRMGADPGCQEITRLRSRALSEAVLQPTTPWGSPRDS